MYTLKVKVPYTEWVEEQAKDLNHEGYAIVCERVPGDDDWVQVWMTGKDDLEGFIGQIRAEIGSEVKAVTPITRDMNPEIIDRAMEIVNATMDRLNRAGINPRF
jgi:hypothetical protein